MLRLQNSQSLPVNDISNRINRFNGQSAFLTERGRAQAVTRGLALDLTSSDRSIVLGDNLFSEGETYTIKVGQEVRTLTSGATVSPAEYVALQQVINGGQQTLDVDQTGRGVSGAFALNSISDGGKTIRAAELVIPEHVTASGNFARHADGLRVTNDLVNYGSIEAYSTDRHIDTAKIGARDINNNAGATISTSSGDLNLTLCADRNINNAGSISSSGNLELSAGHAINNTGTVSSAKDISLTGNSDADLVINNKGGTISALNGAINVRSADYNGLGNSIVNGGDLFSHELNLFSGQGTTDVIVNELTGVVSSSGAAAHVSANTATLVIGSQCLVGDPTYYNVGNIQIAGDIVVGEKLAIIAGGDITRTNSNTTITAIDSVGAGCDINIIAGANVTAGSGETGGPIATQPPITQNTTAPVSFTGASATGGNVDLAGTAFLINAGATGLNRSGGNITIAAYANSSQAKGLINIPFGGSIVTTGVGTGDNGGVTIVGGGIGNTIQLGAQILSHAGQGNTGAIIIATAQPTFSTGTTMTFDTAGNITTGNAIVPAATFNAGGITHSSSVTSAAGDITYHAGGSISLQSFVRSDTPIGTTKNAGDITIISDNGTVVSTSLISAIGQATTQGGDITISGNDDVSTVSLIGVNSEGGTKAGNVSISNTGIGGVVLNGIFTASSSDGDGGQITVTSGSFINSTASTVSANSLSSAAGGTIELNATQIGVLGATVINALGSTTSSINLIATVAGITTNGNSLTLETDGNLLLDLENNVINADSTSTSGGIISLKALSMTNPNESVDNPLVLTANGFDMGSGGQITYIERTAIPTFIGNPLKTPKDAAHFLRLNAHAGVNNGDGGSVTVDVGGDLSVDTDFLDVGLSQGSGAHNGGNIKLSAGSVLSKKTGKLIVTSGLNVDGANGGGGGTIDLASTYTKALVVGGKKQPKHGIFGALSAAGGTINVKNGAGIKVLDSVSTNLLNMEAAGKGKITTADDVTLTATFRALLTSDTGSIAANINFAELFLTSHSSAELNSVNTGSTLVRFPTSADKGFSLDAVGSISYGGIQVADGDIYLHTTTGQINGQSFASLSATNGSITVHTDDVNNGSISFAFGGKAETAGKKGGEVILSVGAIPKKPANSVPDQFVPVSDFVVSNIGRGKTFFGVAPTGITTDGQGPITITAMNKNVIFNTAGVNPVAGGNDISFIGNNVITADPPLRSHVSSVDLALPSSLSTQPSVEILPTATPANTTTDSALAPGFQIQKSVTLPTDLVRTAAGGAQSNEELSSFGVIEPVAISSLYDSYSPSTAGHSGTVDAFVWSDRTLGLSESMMIEPRQACLAVDSNPEIASKVDTAELKSGAILFSPAKDTSVQTPFGTIEIAKGAVAFVMIDHEKLAVYDLHDDSKSSVNIISGAHVTSLHPGRCAFLTRHIHHDFERLNPLERVGYRSLSAHERNGTKIFSCEFSTAHAINSIRPLQAVFDSNHPNARRISDRLLKTTAVLMHLGANREEFRSYASPALAAMR